jgi:hypothetical protein
MMMFDYFHHLTGAFLLSGSTFSALNLTPIDLVGPGRFCVVGVLFLAGL